MKTTQSSDPSAPSGQFALLLQQRFAPFFGRNLAARPTTTYLNLHSP